tara:strand:- start:1492 stop:2526 length:1035 start_codon:yes stop_codon:yes gene_type:complete
MKNRSTKTVIKANGETKHDMHTAFKYHADGIGLCRTEHMFFHPEHLKILRVAIFNIFKNKEEAHEKLLNLQTEQLIDLFTSSKGKSINIRLLDPPLDEFMPKNDVEVREIALALKITEENIKHSLNLYKESNPMMGSRGVRLAFLSPLYKIQIEAIFAAYKSCLLKGVPIQLEITLPFVMEVEEVFQISEQIKSISAQFEKMYNVKLPYKLGVMIEVPSLAFQATELAKHVDFLSFGTNDLTQLIFGLARNDSDFLINTYQKQNILSENPFNTVHDIIITLIEKVIHDAKRGNPNIIIGVCGEHAGDEQSIKKFSKLSLDYLSCSPHRVPEAQIFLEKYTINKE